MLTGTLSAKHFARTSKEKTGESYMMLTKTRAGLSQEAQKAKAFWKMKAAKDAGEEYYDPAREDDILGRNKTISALWEEHLKDPMVAVDQALKCVANSCWKV